MALHLYVGTLTRYYSGDWEPFRSSGGSALPGSDALEVEAMVLEWREWANAEVRMVQEPLTWAEGLQPAHQVSPLTVDELGALQLWAAYSEHPDRSRPTRLPQDWLDDPVLALSMDDDFPCRFPHLLFGVDAWLPVRTVEVFEAPAPCPPLGGEDVADDEDCWEDDEGEDDEGEDDGDDDGDDDGELTRFGSIPALLAELEALNQQTWKADPQTIQGWRAPGRQLRPDFEATARRAYATFLEMAQLAQRTGQPLVLHYQ